MVAERELPRSKTRPDSGPEHQTVEIHFFFCLSGSHIRPIALHTTTRDTRLQLIVSIVQGNLRPRTKPLILPRGAFSQIDENKRRTGEGKHRLRRVGSVETQGATAFPGLRSYCFSLLPNVNRCRRRLHAPQSHHFYFPVLCEATRRRIGERR